MIGSFFKKKQFVPLDTELRKYFEYNLLWLESEFKDMPIEQRKVYLPNEIDFPFAWDGKEEAAIKVFKIVAEAMQINFEEIDVQFYSEGMTELNSGTMPIYLESDAEEVYSGGLFFGKNEEGKYEVSINKNVLSDFEALVATTAHEFAHIKLMGEKRVVENDEMLTELSVVFFGFGVFAANASFRFFKDNIKWGFSRNGYLMIEEWAYCLALLAFLRNDDNEKWSNILNPTVKNEFDKALDYIMKNKADVFTFDEE